MPTKEKQHGLQLQPRDREILASLARFRLLTSHQVRDLHFPGRSLRATQHRLIRLHQHRLAARYQLPIAFGAKRQERAGPVYALASAGAEILDEDVPFGVPWKGVGPAKVLHHLIAVDLFVALTVALREHPDISLAVEPELAFRQRLSGGVWPERSGGPVVVPDGAVTLTRARHAATFYVEIVRADVKGGTRRFVERLRRYASLHHEGVLRSRYGHERVRAVVWLSGTPKRAESLRRAAERLTHGRKLFWFGSYAVIERESRVSTLTPASILAERFTTADGERFGFLS